jgi:hypothetical protein
MTYKPRLNDYVKWNRSTGSIDEGWVYFVSDEYISIEVLVKCKTDENVKDCPLHRKIHVLVVCQNWYWDELEYVTNRRGEDDTYKSQEHRYQDP